MNYGNLTGDGQGGQDGFLGGTPGYKPKVPKTLPLGWRVALGLVFLSPVIYIIVTLIRNGR